MLSKKVILQFVVSLVLFSSCKPSVKVEYYLSNEDTIKEKYIINRFTGEKDGWYEFYNLDGSLAMKCEYKNGYQHGNQIIYCEENGNVMNSCFVKRDKLDGIFTSNYCTTGKLRYNVEYEEDRIISVFNCYSEKGKVLNPGKLINGSGELLKFRPNGEVKERINLKNGLRNGYTYTITNTGYIDSTYFVDGFDGVAQFPIFMY